MSVHHSTTTPTEVRLRLFRNGYHPLPLNGKNPEINGKGWQERRLQTNASEIELWATMYQYATNTGILTRHTPFLDIDILDKDAAEACGSIVAEQFGGNILTRVGLSPKRGFPFRALTPFPKITVNLIAPNENTHRIEFLGDGQQFAAYGVHPDTKLPYSWHGGDLTCVRHDDLPAMDQERAQKLVDDLVAMLIADFGYRREKSREEKKAEREASNGHADWHDFLRNLVDHDNDTALAMALLRTGMSTGAAVNFGRALIECYAPDDDRDRKQRRIDEWPRAVSSARAKIGDPPRDDRPSPLIISSKEFVAEFTPPNYLVERLLTQEFLYSLCGMTGSGKTSITLRLAASVALGILFAGLETVKRRVLYLAAENPLDVQMRWIALAQQMDFDPDTIDVFFVKGVFKISEMNKALVNEAQGVGGDFGLIIIDTGPAFYEGDDANNRVQQQSHARMMRDLIDTIPGKPTVVANVHPIKHATSDNLLPAGGGTFLNEIDGNMTAAKDDTTVELHWQGKWRGVEFAPLNFLIKTVTHERLKDRKGRLMPTVICEHLSEEAKESITKTTRNEGLCLLALIRLYPKASLSNLAAKMGWTLHDGKPNKMKAKRAIRRMKKLVKEGLGGWELTRAATSALRKKAMLRQRTMMMIQKSRNTLRVTACYGCYDLKLTRGSTTIFSVTRLVTSPLAVPPEGDRAGGVT